MGSLRDGEDVGVSGSRGAVHTLSRRGDVYSCSCPAWRFQTLPLTRRTCKHLRRFLGSAREDFRLAGAAGPPQPHETPLPPLVMIQLGYASEPKPEPPPSSPTPESKPRARHRREKTIVDADGREYDLS